MISDLDQTSLFKDLSARELEEVTGFCERITLHDGEILIHENENLTFDLYVLCKGTVEIVSNNSAITSSECVLSREDKELFGEISWLTRRRRTATVRCHGDVEAIRIGGDALLSYMRDNPATGFTITRRVAALLAARLDETDSLLKQILWNTGI